MLHPAMPERTELDAVDAVVVALHHLKAVLTALGHAFGGDCPRDERPDDLQLCLVIQCASKIGERAHCLAGECPYGVRHRGRRAHGDERLAALDGCNRLGHGHEDRIQRRDHGRLSRRDDPLCGESAGTDPLRSGVRRSSLIADSSLLVTASSSEVAPHRPVWIRPKKNPPT